MKFFAKLRWLDGRPLPEVIEPYRVKIINDILWQFDQSGRPKINMALTGRAKKTWKTTDMVLCILYRFVAWPSPWGNDCALIASDLDQYRADLGYGFGTLVDGGGDVYIPGRAVGDTELPPGTTITFYVDDTRKGKAASVGTLVEADLSTATGPAPKGPYPIERTERGTLHAKNWRGSFGFITLDAGNSIFISGATIAASGLPVAQVLGQRVEVDISHLPRGLAAAAIRLIS